jgi:hypothetical protein
MVWTDRSAMVGAYNSVRGEEKKLSTEDNNESAICQRRANINIESQSIRHRIHM